MQPSPVDLVQTSDYLDLVKERVAASDDKKAAFVLSMHDTTNISKAVSGLLGGYHLPVITGLARKGAYKDSLAGGVTVFEPYTDQLTGVKKQATKTVKDECLALANTVADLVGVKL